MAALARGHPEAKKALSKLGYGMEPEGSIYAQTLAHMCEEATVLIELKDGRRVSGCPRNGPQHKDDGINELYLVYPEVLGDDGVSKPIPGGAGVIVPLSEVARVVLSEEPTGAPPLPGPADGPDAADSDPLRRRSRGALGSFSEPCSRVSERSGIGLPAVQVNGIELAVAEHGSPGRPVVVLLHGFPELGLSWRHQVGPLADARYHVLVPDLRGYGASDAPPDPEAYAIDVLARDVLGLIDHAGAETAIVIGHDWGADLAWKTAWLHPDRVSAVGGLSVPFVPRAPAPPLEIMRRHLGEDFYIVWFQQPGVAEAALERDVRRTIATPHVWNAAWAADTTEDPPTPSFLTDAELHVYVDAFTRTGFRGGLTTTATWTATGSARPSSRSAGSHSRRCFSLANGIPYAASCRLKR